MNNNSCSLRFKIAVFLITAAIIAFAFIHSSMPSEQSAEESENVLGFLQYILGFFGLENGLNDHIVRKAAHFIEYTALGVMLTFCAYSFNTIKPYKFSPHIAGAGLLTAVIDETIQLNVLGRAGMIMDVWLDFSGILTGAALMMFVFIIYIRIREKSISE